MTGGSLRRTVFLCSVLALAAAAPLVASPCAARLATAGLDEQLRCLRELRNAGAAAAVSTPLLCDFLVSSDGATDHLAIAAVLDVLRTQGKGAASAADSLSGLLSHRSKLYRNRDKLLVIRLRAYIMVTLSQIGVPSSALPALYDTLAHVDGRMSSVEVASAARAVRSLGIGGRDFAPYLLDIFSARLSEEEVSLERYEPPFPPLEATTAQLEAVRALGSISSAGDEEVMTVLRDLASRPEVLDPRVVEEASRALQQLGRR